MDFRNLIKDVGRILLEMDSSAVAGRVNCIYGCTRRVRGCHSRGETDSSATVKQKLAHVGGSLSGDGKLENISIHGLYSKPIQEGVIHK
jgi:hypothetical protein